MISVGCYIFRKKSLTSNPEILIIEKEKKKEKETNKCCIIRKVFELGIEKKMLKIYEPNQPIINNETIYFPAIYSGPTNNKLVWNDLHTILNNTLNLENTNEIDKCYNYVKYYFDYNITKNETKQKQNFQNKIIPGLSTSIKPFKLSKSARRRENRKKRKQKENQN